MVYNWNEIKSGTMVVVNWPNADEYKYRHFTAPFVGIDSEGFVVLDIGYIFPDNDYTYDGFPKSKCTPCIDK